MPRSPRRHNRTIYVHLWQLAFLNGAGPRVRESGLGLIDGHAFSAPYEDVTGKVAASAGGLAQTRSPQQDRCSSTAPRGLS
jgi:hypothetical protein